MTLGVHLPFYGDAVLKACVRPAHFSSHILFNFVWTSCAKAIEILCCVKMTLEVHLAFYGDAVVKACVSPTDSLAPNKRNFVLLAFFYFLLVLCFYVSGQLVFELCIQTYLERSQGALSLDTNLQNIYEQQESQLYSNDLRISNTPPGEGVKAKWIQFSGTQCLYWVEADWWFAWFDGLPGPECLPKMPPGLPTTAYLPYVYSRCWWAPFDTVPIRSYCLAHLLCLPAFPSGA